MVEDIFMIVLGINACREINAFSYIIFVCVFIYFVVKLIKRMK